MIRSELLLCSMQRRSENYSGIVHISKLQSNKAIYVFGADLLYTTLRILYKILCGLVRKDYLLVRRWYAPLPIISKNITTGASTNPNNLDLNKILNLTKIENWNQNLNLKVENWNLKTWNFKIWIFRIWKFGIWKFSIKKFEI